MGEFNLISFRLDAADASVKFFFKFRFSCCVKGFLSCPKFLIDPILIVGVDAVGLTLLVVAANAAIVGK
jgi:hypothetical protein